MRVIEDLDDATIEEIIPVRVNTMLPPPILAFPVFYEADSRECNASIQI